MNDGSIPQPKSLSPGRSKILRARSLPSSRRFTVAALFSALHYLSMVATLTALVWVFVEPSPIAMKLIVAGVAFSAVTWLIAFMKRRCAHCPLCKGTPLVNSGALPHSRATRLFALNHGVSATLSIIATQSFRCMYCGSDFDLLKTPSYRRGKHVETHLG